MKLLSNLLTQFVGTGTLRVYDADGKLHEFTGSVKDPVVTLRIHDKSLYAKIFLSPDIKAAEAYMDGRLTFEEGSGLIDFLNFYLLNKGGLRGHPLQKYLKKFRKKIKRLHQYNPRKNSEKNVAHHYDLSTDMYKLFLDKDLQYTCAYYNDPETETLEQAQMNKKRHVVAKLKIEDGMSVAELGCGWGGFALYLAQVADVKVTSVNISKEQIAHAQQRAKDLGIEERVDFKLMDYRDLKGQFDRVVSIGMMEHVGISHYPEFLGQFRSLMKPDGAGFIHSIGRMSPPGATNPFIRKYIFPGGHIPSFSEFMADFENARFWLTDCEVLRKHYHYTLMEWRQRFLNNWDKAAEIYDERFCRMWEFYLTGTALGFLHARNMVFHLTFAKQIGTLPMTRDYIFAETERLRRKEHEIGIAI